MSKPLEHKSSVREKPLYVKKTLLLFVRNRRFFGCPLCVCEESYPFVSTVKIDCKAPLWRNALKTTLQEGNDVDLVNVEYTVEGAFCELLAFSHGMTFQLDAKNSAGSFRKRNTP